MESFSVDLGGSTDFEQRFCRHFAAPQTAFAADFHLLRMAEDTPAVARKLEALVYLGNVDLGFLVRPVICGVLDSVEHRARKARIPDVCVIIGVLRFPYIYIRVTRLVLFAGAVRQNEELGGGIPNNWSSSGRC